MPVTMAFCSKTEIDRYGQSSARFSTDCTATSTWPPCWQEERATNPTRRGEATSIYHGSRLDIDMLLSLIEPDASVLDLGCGRGSLLAELTTSRRPTGAGSRSGRGNILASARKGLNVIDHDLNTGLAAFRDDQFDFVILSQTIQAIANTELVIDEMLRVGRRAIVCFPNFAYHKLRRMLFEEGRSPKVSGAYQFEWYNTPNRRFPTIADFDAFCRQKGIQIQGPFISTARSNRRSRRTRTGMRIPRSMC